MEFGASNVGCVQGLGRTRAVGLFYRFGIN